MKIINFFFVFLLVCIVRPVHNEPLASHIPSINLFGRFLFAHHHLENTNFECSTNEECQSFIQDSKCINNICKCPDEKLLSSDASKCIDAAKELGSDCEENIQCSSLLSSGGSCIDGKCKCKSGFHYLKGFCWRSKKLHQTCQKNEQCFSDGEYVGLECKNKACQCRINYYQRLNFGCRRERKDDESCNLDSDCTNQSICEKMTCKKPESYSSQEILIHSLTKTENYTLSTLKCPPGMFNLNNTCFLELGMGCQVNENCSHIEKAICLDSTVCACKPALFVASYDNRKCLKVSLGKVQDISKSSCKENVQCSVFGGNSICHNQKCVCKNGTYWEVKNKYCWTIKALGEICEREEDCYPSVKHAECLEKYPNKEKVCSCQKGFHMKNENCLPDALNLGDHCENDNECLFPNSSCDQISSTCVCKKNYYEENKKCIPGVKSPCSSDADCAHLKNTKCAQQNSSETICQCQENYVSSEEGKYCLLAARFDENCTESFQCKHHLGELSKCENGICQCNNSAHYALYKCYKSKFVGDSCTKKPECLPGNDPNSVICLKGNCACHYDYIPNENRICVKRNSAISLKFFPLLLTSLVLFVFLRR